MPRYVVPKRERPEYGLIQMQSNNPKRHGLSPDQARDLCQKILSFAKADHTRVNINSGISGFTRTALNRVTTAGETNNVSVRITSVFAKRVASVDTNRLDDASLQRAVRDAESLARIAPENPEYLPEFGEQKYTTVDGYYASTGDLTTESRALAASLGIKAADSAKFLAAGFIDVSAGSEAIATSNNLFGYYSGTNVASTLTIRATDGLSSGWAGGEGADWNTIESDRIAETALRKCRDWHGKTALEPGKYEAILEPAAVGMLMYGMLSVFDARQADEGRSYFSKQGGGNRLGETLFDERVTIVSNPAEKNAETSPFTNAGLPIQREVWVEKGVLKSLAYSRFWAMKQGVAPRANPSNFIMSGGDASLEDMIKSVKRGVLITRFWYIRRLNPRIISSTGLTRDGTFLIENGKIARPVTNFRFNQSLAQLLANVEMVGRSSRVATEAGTPFVVPALKVKEFTLASVSDAI
jgi:predicted Zn-dependent protease